MVKLLRYVADAITQACRYRLACGVVFWLYSSCLIAAPLVVVSQDSEPYRDVATAVAQYYGLPVKISSLAEIRAQPELINARVDITVAIGTVAAEYLLRYLPPSQRLVASFLPRSTWLSLISQHSDRWQATPANLSVVFLDQPLSRYVALARRVVPDAHRLGATAPGLSLAQTELEQAASRFHFQLRQQPLDPENNPVRQLQPLIRDSDVFLPIPESTQFNRNTAKWILYVSYRQQVPLIGFSRKYVEAGAVAGIYSSPEQIGRQVGELLERYNPGSTALPDAQFPSYFSVVTNRAALRNLQLRLPPDEWLTDWLQQVMP